MQVLKIKNKGQAQQLVHKRGANLVVPVHDANGDLVIPVEVTQDPVFADLFQNMLDKCELIEYIPGEGEYIETLRGQGKVVTFTIPTEDTPANSQQSLLRRVAAFFGF
jgi:hypothetical protein